MATWASGSGFFITLSKTYTDGLAYVIASVGEGISFLILALFLIPRMGEFLGKISIAEAMGELYGKHVRVITAVAGTIGSAGLVAAQFKVFGSIFAYFLYIPKEPAIIIAGMIVIIYSAFGGIRAVTFTDVLQFFTFGFILPLVGFIIWNQFYHNGLTLEHSFADSKFNLNDLFNSTDPRFFSMITMFIYFAIPTFSAPAFQRIAIGSSIAQVKKAFLIAGLFLVIIKLLIAWIPFLLYSIDSSIKPDRLLAYVIDHYSYTGLKGLIVVAVIAFAMSTADSRINSASVLFTNDIYRVFNFKWKSDIFISRLFAFILGMGSIVLSLFKTDILDVIVFANSFYYPIVTPPFIMTVLGFRSSTKSVLIGISAGFIINILWQTGVIVTPLWKLLPSDLASVSKDMVGVLLCMLSNLIFLVSSHYLLAQKGGWVGIKDRTYLDERKIIQIENRANLRNSILNFNFNRFLNKIAPNNDLTYTMLGIYFIICTFTTMYSTQVELSGNNSKMILLIYQIMMVTGTVIALYPLWPLSINPKIKERIIKIIWPIATFYMLVFFSTFFVMVSKFGMLQVAVYAVNLMIVALFFGWRLGIITIATGFYLGIKFYHYNFPTLDLSHGFSSPEFILMYVLLLIGTTLIIFLKPKQEYIEATEHRVDILAHEKVYLEYEVSNLNEKVCDLDEKVVHYTQRVADQAIEIERLGATAQKILNNVNHELRLPVGNVMNFAEMLSEGLGKYTKKQLKELSDEVFKNSNRLSTMILNMLDLAMLDAKKIALDKKTINLSELVEDRVSQCSKIYLQGKDIRFQLKVEPNILIDLDANYIRQTVDNLIINAINYSNNGIIKVSILRNGPNSVELIVQDEGIGIPETQLYDIFTPFKMGAHTESKAEGRGVGLALCKSAIDAHGGSITVTSEGGRGAMFRVIFNLV